MSKTLPMKRNRAIFQDLVARADHLSTFGSHCQHIIADFQRTDIARQPIKGLNPYQLQQHVIKYANRLFRAERRIIKEAPEQEWCDDNRLQCVGYAMYLQEMAQRRGFELSLKPSHYVLHLRHLKIPCNYTHEEVDECEELLELYQMHDPCPDRNPS